MDMSGCLGLSQKAAQGALSAEGDTDDGRPSRHRRVFREKGSGVTGQPAPISIQKGRLLSIFRRFSRPMRGIELQKTAHLHETRLLF